MTYKNLLLIVLILICVSITTHTHAQHSTIKKLTYNAGINITTLTYPNLHLTCGTTLQKNHIPFGFLHIKGSFYKKIPNKYVFSTLLANIFLSDDNASFKNNYPDINTSFLSIEIGKYYALPTKKIKTPHLIKNWTMKTYGSISYEYATDTRENIKTDAIPYSIIKNDEISCR